MPKKFIDPLNQKFELPKALLKQISECTNGNFILFFADSYNSPDVRAEFSSPLQEMGLRMWSSKFLQGINTAEEIDFCQDNMNGMPDDMDEFGED